MEDRATLKNFITAYIKLVISRQFVNKSQVLETFKKMAVVVDEQNKHDDKYIPMSQDFDNSIAFNTAIELILKGKEQPSGYTEPILA